MARLRNPQDPNALTEDETAFLRSTAVPAVLREFAARQHDSIGTHTTAYRKIAAAARAEREALWEVAILQTLRVKANLDDAAAKALEVEVVGLRRDVAARDAQLATQTKKLRAVTAAPARAVYAD